MKRVAILSNLDEQCGNAAYGRILTSHLAQWFQVGMYDHATWGQAGAPDVVIINWHPARVHTSAQHVRALQDAGSKVVLLFQNSFDFDHHVEKGDILDVVDAIVAHEPMNLLVEGTAWEHSHKFNFIPHGILELPKLPGYDGKIIPIFGTAGFQFPWKRTDVLIKAAKHCQVQARIFCPPYPGFDRNREIDKWHLIYKNVDVDRNWLSEGQVIQALSEHVLNVFWFQSQSVEDQFGQTGSARMGLAARRPTIISRHRKFRTLFPYADELYIAETEEEVYAAASEILADPYGAKRPDRLMREMGWSASAAKYKKLLYDLLQIHDVEFPKE